MKAKNTNKADVAPAQVDEPYQIADSASESARQLSKSASLHLAHPWQAHSAHEFAASRHEVESGTSKIPEDRERHFRLASEHRKAAEYWAKKEAESGDRRAPASGQHISLDLQTVIQDQINQGTYKESVFAAAPELLEALRNLVQVTEVRQEDMQQARAAIAKAEGRE